MARFVSAAFALAVLLSIAPAAGAARSDTCRPPRCVDISVPVPPGLKVPDNRARVLLPSGYRAGGAGFPVLYLLHGAGDTFRTWTENTDVIEFSRQFDVIIVMPDGGRGENAGWYSDWIDDSRDWESFHIDVLIDHVDRRFNTLGDGHRAVAGLSMGGFGAMSYAARHPEVFAAAASFSGAVDTRYLAPASGEGFKAFHDQFGTPDERVWGDQLTNADEWAAHNPTDRAADLACTKLWIASGTGTPGGPAGDDPQNPAGYGIENVIFQMNVSFVRALTFASVDYEYFFYPGGYHGWPYWQLALHWALPEMAKAIDDEVGPGACDS